MGTATDAGVPPVEASASNVVEALRRVMRDLPAIGKDGRAAREQGGYAYRGIEQITKEAQGLCAQHGVIFTPRVVCVPEVVEITVNSKPWTDTRMLVEYDVRGPGGAEDVIVVGPIFAIGRDNSDKGANKCMTQAFKYALLQTFMIADSKDDADGSTFEAEAGAESGNPYRRATLRDDVTPADVDRMRTGELAERLAAAGLDNSGTLKAMRDRLTEHLAAQPPAAPDGEQETPTAPGSPAPESPLCARCKLPDTDDNPLGEVDGVLYHAACAP